MSAEGSAGPARRLYANPYRTNRRRTITGGTLVSLIIINEVPLHILSPVHHHPITHTAIAGAAAILGSDYVLEGLVRLKRWLSCKIFVIDLGSRDRAPRE